MTSSTHKEILAKIAQQELEHQQAINTLRFAAYNAWVEEGGKDKAQAEAAAEKSLGKLKYKTHNGLTVHNLRQAGVEVSISHIRFVQMDDLPEPMPVPSYLRRMYAFLPRGGATHITLKRPDGKWCGVSSVCHKDDSFDYKLGVKIALDQLTQAEADSLLEGLTVFEENEENAEVPAERTYDTVLKA